MPHQYKNMELETTNTPNDLCCVLQGLNAAQKANIRDMGFESLLSFNIKNIPAALGYWLLVNYDHERNELNVGSHIIDVTPSKVRDVFGVPMGRIPVSEHKRARLRDVMREEWKNQFIQTHVTVKNVIGKLKSYKKGGTLFKLNFLVLFNTIMGETTKRAAVNQKFLASIMNESDICNMDWCSYVITCLKRTKEGWNGKELYNGPLTFLAVLYAHEHQLKRCPENAITPAIKYVTTDYLVDLDLESSMRGKGRFLNYNVEAQIDEGQTAIEQNVIVSQSEQTPNPKANSVETGGATREFMDRSISRCNQLETLSDENLVDDVVIELLEPKQEECEFGENMYCFMFGSFSSHQSGIARVGGYKVNVDVAPTLAEIIKKHGDFAAGCIFKSDPLKSAVIESICGVYREIQTNDTVTMSKARSAVNIDVSWLEALLEPIHKRKEAAKQYGLCLELKATTILLERVAQKDVRDRRAELVAAQERSKEAERCMEVLRLVVKHLHENLLKYEAESCVVEVFN